MNEELIEKCRLEYRENYLPQSFCCLEASEAMLRIAIPLISAEARKQERERLGNWLASNVKAIGGGEAFWFTNAVEKLQRGQALKEGGKEADNG